MADYFARVELHGASWPTGYHKLHEALAKHGFNNFVVSTKGRKTPSDGLLSFNRTNG